MVGEFMNRKKFLKLYEALKERIEKEGKKSPDWFLGFVEGFGNQKLTGYQIGALYHLMVLHGPEEPEPAEDEKDVIAGDDNKISIPGVL